MTTREVFMAGLPDAGKTTFIAALWELIFAKTENTELQLDGVEGVELEYLNSLRNEWRQAKAPERTKFAKERTAVINLKSRSGDKLKLSLEDFAGEGFRQMWSERRASGKMIDLARRSDRHLLLINVSKIVYPRTADELKDTLPSGAPGPTVPFDPKKCPTAVQVTDVLQHMLRSPISARPHKIAVALTAWDEVAEDGLSPDEILKEKLPMVHQYLSVRGKVDEIKLFGVSAQGGNYTIDAERRRVLKTPVQADRITLVDGDDESRDLTQMLAWLLN